MTQKHDSLKQKPQKEEMKAMPERRMDRRAGFEQMRKNMEAYEAELQKIMTEEQFNAYKADREKRMKEGPRGRRPQQNEN